MVVRMETFARNAERTGPTERLYNFA